MRIAFYYPLIIVGGVEIALRNLLQRLKAFDCYVVYNNQSSDVDMLLELSKYATVVNKLDYADIVVECSIFSSSRIECQYRIQWIHGNVVEMGFSIPTKRCDKYIAVTDECARQFKAVNKIDCDVYKNELDIDIINKSKEPCRLEPKGLVLMTVSRIAHQKGFDRIPILIDELKMQGIEFTYYIIGKGFNKNYEEKVRAELKEVIFLGEKKNPYKYMSKAGYIVQLSDAESFGLSTMEGQVLGIPSIVTNYLTTKETLKDNAHILKLDMSNVNEIVSKLKNKPKTRNYKGDSDKFIELFNSINIDNKNIIVECINNYFDIKLNKEIIKGTILRINKERLIQLKNLVCIKELSNESKCN